MKRKNIGEQVCISLSCAALVFAINLAKTEYWFVSSFCAGLVPVFIVAATKYGKRD